MKFRLSLLHVLVLSCIGFSNGALAQNQANAAPKKLDETQQIQNLTDQTKQLQIEVALLEAQLKKNTDKPTKAVKKLSQNSHHRNGKSLTYAAVSTGTQTDATSGTSNSNGTSSSSISMPTTVPTPTAAAAQAAANSIAVPTTSKGKRASLDASSAILQQFYLLGTAPIYLGGIPVIISPYLGVPAAYDASDLIANISLINSQLLLLQQRQSIENVYNNNGLPVPTNSFMALSGLATFQVSETRPFTGGNRQSDIDLSALDLDYIAGIGPWVTLLVTLDYDNLSPQALSPPQNGPRVLNSRVFVDQGLFVIGNLNRCDFYISVGQMYIPFGQYGSYVVGSPLTSSLAQTKQRAVLLGVSHTKDVYEFDAQIYAYKGDTFIGSPNSSQINEAGGNVDLYVTKPNWSLNIGGGLITNIADSQGMQINGNAVISTLFGGFGSGIGTGRSAIESREHLFHRVPAADVHGNITLGKFSAEAEYITIMRPFAPGNLFFRINQFGVANGARPKAFDGEASYKFDILGRPSSFALGYSSTRDCLGLTLPAQQYGASFNTSIWRSTVESLGVTRQVNYGNNTFSDGQGIPTNNTASRLGLSKTSDSITFQMSVYF